MATRILIVEDDRTQLELYADLVRLFGYSPWAVSSRAAAIDLIADTPPDLVLLDLRLSDGSGWSFYEAMRDDAQWDDVPVVVVSGDLKAAGQRDDWEQGRLSLLMKPFDLSELRAAIKDTLSAAGARSAEPAC